MGDWRSAIWLEEGEVGRWCRGAVERDEIGRNNLVGGGERKGGTEEEVILVGDWDMWGPDLSAKAIYIHLTKRMPNYFCIRVLNLMKQEKTRRVTRLHAICVLQHMLVSDGGELFSRFNSRTVVELRRELLGWLRHFRDGCVAGILCEIGSVLVAQMLPVGKWLELEGFLTRYIQKQSMLP
ncbi:hypothetical protein RHMOL_Rhmol02G0059400 [Rhododendron molle]|uniref:Uncharacterized protein n=1 Tax=Rhododendron molle TaxID=49168 RepID=A0ACC0PMD2_RHOML|nr:hypothetical protein RHMOL_Rhmol02G0059400 [Rhododendron molle]